MSICFVYMYFQQKWSDELATVAQNYANKCVSGHNPNKYDEAESFKRVGENLYYSKGKYFFHTLIFT